MPRIKAIKKKKEVKKKSTMQSKINSRSIVKLSPQQIVQNRGVCFELFSKDNVTVFYTTDKFPLNRIQYRAHFYCVDNDYEYTPFCHDFGPPNLYYIYQFCNKMSSRIQNARMKKIYLNSSQNKDKLANGLVLVGCYLLLNQPKLVTRFLRNISSLPLGQFRDALSSIDPIRTVTVEDCMRGFKIALNLKWFSLNSFDPESYVNYALVEKGDLNWIVPNKFIAFMGPLDTSTVSEYYGFPLYTPEDHLTYFHSNNVKMVIRLNEICYDKTKFTRNMIKHYDLIFPDNSVPPIDIVEKFLEIVESEPGAIAVHCKQGLGRTGTLIACYLIKHYSFTAKEATAYIRLCRPGSVIAIQQSFLERIEVSLKRSKKTKEKITENACEVVVKKRCRVRKMKRSPRIAAKNASQKRKRNAKSPERLVKKQRILKQKL